MTQSIKSIDVYLNRFGEDDTTFVNRVHTDQGPLFKDGYGTSLGQGLLSIFQRDNIKDKVNFVVGCSEITAIKKAGIDTALLKFTANSVCEMESLFRSEGKFEMQMNNVNPREVV